MNKHVLIENDKLLNYTQMHKEYLDLTKEEKDIVLPKKFKRLTQYLNDNNIKGFKNISKEKFLDTVEAACCIGDCHYEERIIDIMFAENDEYVEQEASSSFNMVAYHPYISEMADTISGKTMSLDEGESAVNIQVHLKHNITLSRFNMLIELLSTF